jgi:hypothetical protein
MKLTIINVSKKCNKWVESVNKINMTENWIKSEYKLNTLRFMNRARREKIWVKKDRNLSNVEKLKIFTCAMFTT